jgi:hypothetical protein
MTIFGALFSSLAAAVRSFSFCFFAAAISSAFDSVFGGGVTGGVDVLAWVTGELSGVATGELTEFAAGELRVFDSFRC